MLVIFSSILFSSIFHVSFFISTKIGSAPTRRIALTVGIPVYTVVITSSPLPIPKLFNETISDCVPETTKKAYLTPKNFFYIIYNRVITI